MFWDDLHKLERNNPMYPAESVVRFLFDNFSMDMKKRKDIKILDLGCGTGRHVKLFAEQGFNVYGCDFSNVGINETQKKINYFGLKAELAVADMINLPYANNFFSGVICFGVFYYGDSNDMKKAIDELFRILKKDGRAIVISRTTDDFRFSKGELIEKNTYKLKINVQEKNVKMHFLRETMVYDYFSKFTDIELKKNDTYHADLKTKGSNWVITLKK